MELRDRKTFANGGMNQDDSFEHIAPNDFISAYNVRVTGTTDSEKGIVTDIDSTEIIAGTRATGINKGIGAEGFTRTRKGYVWVYNSQGYHQLIEIDYDEETETVIFENITDSGGVNILPLDPQYYVNDIKLINGNFLVFTDNNNEPGYISLERLKDGSLGTLTADDFKLIKAQPMVLPVSVYGDDPSRSVNLLRQNLFQPIYQYVYSDDEYSAWSSMGKRPVPETESTPAIGTDVSKSNHLIVSVDAGTDRVKTLNVGMRIGLLDFFLVKSIDRTEVVALTDTTVDVSNQIYQAYDPATNLYSFAFYNDGLYTNIDVLETDLPYDYVPLKAGAMEVVNGSILTLGDITEGYERPTIDASFTVSSYNPDIAFDIPAGDPLRQSQTWSQYRPSGKSYRKVTVPFTGIPETGDSIRIITGSVQDADIFTDTTVPITVAEDGNLLLAIQKVASSIPFASSVTQSGSTVTLTFTTRKASDTPDGDNEECQSVIVSLANVGSGQSKSISALKTNSSYQLAIRCKDDKGRYFPLATGTNYVVKTQSFSQLLGLTPVVHWEINDATAPEGAAVYQLMLSVNNTHQNTLWMNAILDATSTNSDYFVFKINSLLKFNNNNSSSILSYDYTAGDRCTFVYELTSGTKTWFDKIDVQVAGFEIDATTTPGTTDYLLKVFKPASITEASITGKNILLEIYTPRKRATVSGDTTTYNETLFFEIGEQYDIVNGQFSVLSGDITDGDIYLKTRELANAVDPNTNDVYVVEDFNFSDFYQSNYNSYGRAGTYEDVRGRVNKTASIRYSDTFLEGSRINGITRFYGERIYGDGAGQTSSNYGAIRKMVQVDNTLVVIQDTKVGRVPVNISIIEDQIAQDNVAVSDRLLNFIRYSDSGNYGIGTAKESFAQRPDGTIYFIDPNNSLPIRVGRDGTRPIPGKMSKFFLRALHAANEAGLKIIGQYNIVYDEYLVCIEQLGDVVTQFPFSASNWRFLETYTVLPGDITITTNPTKGTVTYDNVTGIATYIPGSGQSGSDNFIQTFNVAGVPTTKRTCINITPGDGTPNPFYFLDVTNANLSTVYTSNSILVNGINMPTSISISAGEFRINGTGAWYNSASTGITVENEDTVEVRQTSSPDFVTATDITLTIGGISDTYTVTTKAAVPVTVNYSLTKDASPHVDLLIVPVVNGVSIGNIYPTSTGTFAGIFAGDTVYVGMAHSVTGFPWPTYSKANFVVKADGVIVYDSGDKTDPLVTDLANYTFTAVAGVVYDVIAVSDSTATSYSPVAFSMNNASSAPLSVATEVVSFEFVDNTDGLFVMHTGQYTQPQNNVGFNWLTDANTGKLTIVNNSAYSLDFVLSNTAEGGSYSSSLTIASGATGEFNTLPKTGYSITYTDTIMP